MNPDLLVNSLVLVLGTTALALGLACPVAFAARLAGESGRRWIVAACVLTLALPGFFVSGMWMEWIGFAGAWRVAPSFLSERWMPIAVSTGVLALLLWPVGALLLAGAWDRWDLRVLEADGELRGGALISTVVGPGLRQSMLPPAILIAVLALSDFAVPALFQARVWPSEIWIEYSTRLDAWSAGKRCWPLGILAVVLVAMACDRRWTWSWPASDGGGRAALLRERLGGGWVLGTRAFAAGVIGVALVFPLVAALGSSRTWRELLPAAQAAGPVASRTFLYSAVTATLVTLLGIAFVNSRRWAVTALPFVIPGVVTGMIFAELTAGAAWDGFREAGGVMVMAWATRYFFLGWLVARRLWKGSDPKLREWIGMAGGGRLAEGWHAVMLGRPGSVAGVWFVVYLLCLWDVETAILVAPPGGDTLGLMIFNLLHYGHNAQVTALCAVLGMLAIAPWVFWAAFRGVGVRVGGHSVVLLFGALSLAAAVSGCAPDSGAGASGAPTRNLESGMFERVEVIGGRGTGPGYFSKPRSVAVDGGGKVYVVDMTGRVQRFGSEGAWELLWQMPETTLGRPKGMDAGPGSGVWVVEPHYHRVNGFGVDGQLVAQWGSHGLEPGELWFPRAIALAGDGTCYVSEYGRRERIQRFRVGDGAYLGGFGGEGTEPGQLNRAEGLAVGPRGEVYVADSCNHRIQVFSAEGSLLRVHGKAGQGPGEFSYPYDIRVDAEGRQYVCEFGNSRVQVLGPDDQPLEILGGPGRSADQFNNPWSLCLDAGGNLYVADSLNHRVVKYVRRSGPERAAPRAKSAAAAPLIRFWEGKG
ncbi:MAG: 6-bladed beta-propeller [Limisphaerales bacterium]